MSKTIRVRIETTARIVISKETEVAVLANRASLLKEKEERPERYEQLSGSRKALVDTLLADDFDIVKFVQISVRGGIREFTKDELCRKFTQEGMVFDRAQAKVTFSE